MKRKAKLDSTFSPKVLHNILDNENVVAAPEEDINPEPRKTTRKRKRPAEKNSPVDAISGQGKPVGPGFGQTKPPKKAT